MKDQQETAVALEGVVNRYFEEKHFGFIRYPSGEMFFHQFDVVEAQVLPRGTRVRFNIGTHKKRPVAINVTPLTPVPARPTTDGEEGAE